MVGVTATDRTDTTAQQATFAQVGKSFYPTIVAIFAPLLLISNICATKGIAFGPVVGNWSILTDGGFFLFPLAYVLGDVLSEVYGFKATRRAIYIGFGLAVLGGFSFWLAMVLPAADFYQNQSSFETVIRAFLQVLLASLAGYMVGQTLNALVVVRIKARTKEKHLWARLVGSTVVGEFADTLVFCAIAAGAIGISTANDFITYVALGFVYKSLLEVALMPITYRVIAYVKKHEPTYQAAG
ncbi:queuosine precursor transporter [Rhodococcus sp. D2-41]|uniref:Probable queuosine precursor transporter n=1 Tax=Speluncibacter jeojiensis TaxID=2710754 RepID=A0A9X4LZI7_9ACTN|nr:queuosine precursor transporter [Rhodococcus sp. D2-41]MDG3010377.1 queuosine precursor transporter [Rhodococcus sp. D2-41]MDG3014114.1 queuosine precursor transporter [Corynebacteriales bacterium D3-21]